MKQKLIILAAAALMPLGSLAQSLNKEITVERDIVPEQREATRIGFTPRISLRPVTLKQLSYAQNGVTARVPASISVLDPAAYADSIYVSPYRGYVAAGFMPRFNAALSLGYRIIDNEKTRLGAWVQYDGTNYKYNPEPLLGVTDYVVEQPTFKRQTVTAAVDLHQAVGSRSAIDAAFDYTFAAFNLPKFLSVDEDLFNQTANRLNLDAQWSSGVNDLGYTVGAAFRGFGYGKVTKTSYLPTDFEVAKDALDPVKETNIDVNGSIRADFDDNSFAELGIDFSSVSNNRSSWLRRYYNDVASNFYNYYALESFGGRKHWLLRFTPRYRYTAGVATLDLGVKIDLTHNAGKAFHIAPDVTIGLNPSSKFAVSFRAGGGEVQNTLASVYDITPYNPAFLTYSNSHVPYTFDADITVGPFSGAYLNIFGGYAKANDWLLPEIGMMRSLVGKDVKGWHAGVALGYKWRNIVDARVSFETASHSDKDKSTAYYLWRDRAKFVVDASVTVRPISPLEITLGYNLRSGRKIFGSSNGFGSYNVYELASISNLTAGASWMFTPQLSVFAKGENLLNHQTSLLGFVPAQGITGLAGVSYKF